MTIWDGGWPDQPEPEREDGWAESDDEQADGWKGGEPLNPGEEWKPEGWRQFPMGPEEEFYRRKQNEEEQDGS